MACVSCYRWNYVVCVSRLRARCAAACDAVVMSGPTHPARCFLSSFTVPQLAAVLDALSVWVLLRAAHGVSMTFTTHQTTQHRLFGDRRMHVRLFPTPTLWEGTSFLRATTSFCQALRSAALPARITLVRSLPTPRTHTHTHTHARTRTHTHTPCTTFSHHAAPPPTLTTLPQLCIQARAQRLAVNCGAGGRPHRAAVRQGAT
jgi:hypothetical protein